MSAVSNRPALDETMAGVVFENCAESLDNPLRGGTTYLARAIRPGQGHAPLLDSDDWAFLADKVGCIVHEAPDGQATITYFTDHSALEEAWERVEEQHHEDVEATE